MLMGDKCSLLCLHGASLTDRLVGGVWHRGIRVYLTSVPLPDGPAIYGPGRRRSGPEAGAAEAAAMTGEQMQEEGIHPGRVERD